jgi:hypothetical protein
VSLHPVVPGPGDVFGEDSPKTGPGKPKGPGSVKSQGRLTCDYFGVSDGT